MSNSRGFKTEEQVTKMISEEEKLIVSLEERLNALER